MMIKSTAFIAIVFTKTKAKRNINFCHFSLLGFWYILLKGGFLRSFRAFKLSSCKDNII